MKNFITAACALSLCLSSSYADEPCTYSDWAWDVNQKKAVEFETITTTKARLSEEQFHPDLPCSICEEDMATLKIGNLAPIKVCAVVARDIDDAIRQARNEGFPIESLTGYRVGRTKGPLDSKGRRTEYSNHSFGLAIDINAETNGLYGNCVSFSAACELRRGGYWDTENPSSITPQSPIYHAMRAAGFRWGGELFGRQKDFMHFSLGGD